MGTEANRATIGSSGAVRTAIGIASGAVAVLAFALPASAAGEPFPGPGEWTLHLAGTLADEGPASLRLAIRADSVSATFIPRLDEPSIALVGPGPAPPADPWTAGLALDLRDDGEPDSRARHRLRATLDPGSGRLAGVWETRNREARLELEIVAEDVIRTWTRGPRLRSTLSFPQLRRPRPAAGRINDWLEEVLRVRQDEFLRPGVESLAGFDAPSMPWHQDIACSLAHWSPDLVSLVGRDSHATGGAHPNVAWFALSFRIDGDDLRLLSLADLFREGSGWESWLAERIRDGLDRQATRPGAIGSDGTPGADDHDVWYVTREGLTFVFAPYRGGPFADGTRRVTIPFDRLESRAARAGPLPLLRGRAR